MTGNDNGQRFHLPKITDYFREDFVLLDGDLAVRFASNAGGSNVPGLTMRDLVSASDYPRIREALEEMAPGDSPFELTLADDGGTQIVVIHRLGVDDQLVGFLCVFHSVAAEREQAIDRKSPAESQVTEREHEIIRLLLSGMRNREIADLLNVAEITVKKHLGSIYRKLHVRNRVELIRLWEHE